jgi:hypothetical protein
MVIILPNGLKVDCTPDQIASLCNTLGINHEYYYSNSRGYIKIADMETTHLKNALLARYRTWVSNLSNLSHDEIVNALTTGITDPIYLALEKEYCKRFDNGSIPF